MNNMDENNIDYTKEEEDTMAVFSKPVNFSFCVSESKSEDFMKKDTRLAFSKTIEKFKKHEGKTTSSK